MAFFLELTSTGSGLPMWLVAFALPAASSVVQTSFPDADPSSSNSSALPKRKQLAPPANLSLHPPLHIQRLILGLLC